VLSNLRGMSSIKMTTEINGVRRILIKPVKTQIYVPGTRVKLSAWSHEVCYRNVGSDAITKIRL
jgi:hypothetical protein